MTDYKGIHDRLTRDSHDYRDGWGRSWRMREWDIAINALTWGVVITLVAAWLWEGV